MTIIVSRHGFRGDLEGYIARHETLLRHLQDVAAGKLPSAEEIAAAPVIDHYQLGQRATDCLVGFVDGHPRIKGGVTTSELWTIAPDLGWARTFSRLYQLGRPAGFPDRDN